MKKAVSFILSLVILIGLVPHVSASDKVGADTNLFASKKVSILSHSASTYIGVSNNSSANSTTGSNDVYYTEGRHDVFLEDTWWQQVIDALGMDLLVNNSWSGSCVFMPRKGEASVGYGDRAINLHNDTTGEEPDVIFIYLGCNDFAYYKETFGKAADVDYTAIIQDNGNGSFSYAAPSTTCEAYAIMLHKVQTRYPDAEVYCMTSTARRETDYTGDTYPDAGQPTEYSAQLQQIAAHFEFPVIDLENAIPKEVEVFDLYMGDKRAHPNALGMDQITNEVLSVMLGKDVEICHVTSEDGTVREQAVLSGSSYCTDVKFQNGYSVIVTMSGENITDEVFKNGKISIDAVTGDISISSVIQRNPLAFRWELQNDVLVSVGNTDNPLTKLAGSITDGVLSNTRYSLEMSLVLKHDLPWELEWQCAGNWRGCVFSSDPAQSTKDMVYLSRTTGGQLCFGTWGGNQYNNYGVDLSSLDDQMHTYRLENRISGDGENMVWVYVDDEEIGPMNRYFIGSKDQSTTSDWISGRDFVFPYISMDGHALKDCTLNYLTIQESVHTHVYAPTVTTPTYAEQGYTVYTCDCGESYHTPWLDKNAYEGKTIACIGDSITSGVGVTKGENDYVTLLAEHLGMEYIRLGVSGTTLCTDGSRTCNISRLTENYLNGADIVTIAMGINDFCAAGEGYYELGTIDSTDTSTIYGAVKMWCDRIEELRKTDSLSDTQFYFVTPVICSWNNSVTSSKNWDQSKANIHGYTLRDLCNAIIETAALYEVAVIDLNLLSGMYYVNVADNNTTVFGGDGVHPGVTGHAMMASAIANALLQNNLRDDHDHTYGSWITTTWPSCATGQQQRVCTVCSATESRTVDPVGIHSYTPTGIAPTCTEPGHTTYTCVCGDNYVSGYTEATGHNYKNGVCTVCGDTTWDINGNGVLDVLTIGNSHTANYTEFFPNVLTDLYADGLATKISLTKATIGSIGLYSGRNSNANATYRSHLSALNDGVGAYKYLSQKQYDLVIVQDYMESLVDEPAIFADGLASVIQKVREIATENGFTEPPVAWFADWVDIRSSGGDTALRDGEGNKISLPKLTREETYQKSMASIAEVESRIAAGNDNMPIFVIHASTIKQNALSSYLGTTKLWENQKYCLLESDTTHVTNELGKYLMAVGALSEIIGYYADNLSLGQSGTNIGAALTLQNGPAATGTGSQYEGSVNAEVLAIIRESVSSPVAFKQSAYITDPISNYVSTLQHIAWNFDNFANQESALASIRGQIDTEIGDKIDSYSVEIVEFTSTNQMTINVRLLHGYSLEEVEIVLHCCVYSTTVTAPTCTEQGYTTYTCDCGNSYVDDYVSAEGAHNFTEWSTTKEATYNEDGTESRKCTKCSHVEFRNLSVSVVTTGNLGKGTTPTDSVIYTLYSDGTMVLEGTGALFGIDWRGDNQPFIDFRSQVKHLIIGEGITSTTSGSLVKLSNLETIQFPSTLTHLPQNALMSCFRPDITELTIPATVVHLGAYSIGHYTGDASAYFTDVIIENPNIQITDHVAVFNGGAKLDQLTLYSYGSSNQVSSYAEKYGIRYIDLNNYLEGNFGDIHYELSNGILVLEPQVENASIPAGNLPWASYAESITKVEIAEGIVSIPRNAFSDYPSLTTASLPSSLQSIGDAAFSTTHINTTRLVMTLPKHLTTLGQEIFKGRSNVDLTVYSDSLGAKLEEPGVNLTVKKVFKLMLIGNSYSEDASNGTHTTGSQLLDILQAMLGENAEVTVALLSSGGKGMHWHATQAEQRNPAYSFKVISTSNPTWKSLGSYTSADALAWTDWDAVSLQPYNINVSTGQESVPYPDSTDPKFYHIEDSSSYMLDYVARYAPYADIYFYMHWAQTSSTALNAALSNYNKNAAFMPQVLQYSGTESGAQFKTIIPVGLSIQNARTTYLALLRYNTTAYADGNLNLTTDAQIGLQRDGGHVSFNIGRYIAALTFAETIIPEAYRVEGYVLPNIRITESVGKLPNEYSEIAQKAVFAAVNGWKNGSLAVTNIDGYTQDPTIAAGETVKNLSLHLSYGDADVFETQIRNAALAVLPTDFSVDDVSVNTDTETADITIRFGYTSMVVNVPLTIYRLAITAQPVDAEISIGQRVPVAVVAEGDSLTYQWYYKDAGMKDFGVSVNKTSAYSYTMQSYMHNRQLYCVITDMYGNQVTTDVVTITRPPIQLALLSQPQDVETEPGSQLRITFSVRGDGLSYQWYYKDASMKNFAVSSIKGSAYSCIMQSYMNNRQVYCVITDMYGNQVETDVVTITRPPVQLEILSEPEDVCASVGERFSIKVKAQGDGLSYQWYYKDAGMKSFDVSVNKSSAYSYTMQSYMHNRQVYCVITDKYGNQVITDVATITRPPIYLEILSEPEDVYAALGEKFSARVTARGDGLTYQWYYKDAGMKDFKPSSNRSAAYSYAMQSYMDGRQVYCVITDMYGNQETTAVVTLTLTSE